ncbi:MAG TPA: alpha-glucuronidase family glycosyl hydrolase, partial [Chryseolinea sp.]|nr:alpha-glucuronidase family glycosyl hydrolase [Chryseolinea sp.]
MKLPFVHNSPRITASITLLCAVLSLWQLPACAHDGYDLWLRYTPIDATTAAIYRNALQGWSVTSRTATAEVIRTELLRAFPGILGTTLPELPVPNVQHQLVIGTVQSPLLAALAPQLQGVAEDGFLITPATINGKASLAIVSATEQGMLYGTFHFLRMLQTEQ